MPDNSFCPNACSFSFVVLPDTQRYTANTDKAVIFDCQTEWIKANQDMLKIAFVLHDGDVVTKGIDDTQWARGKKSMCILDSAGTRCRGGEHGGSACTGPDDCPGGTCAARLPYVISLGNMDGPQHYSGYAHNYFPLKMFRKQMCGDPTRTCAPALDSWDGTTIDYTSRTFNVCGLDWIPLAFRWRPDLVLGDPQGPLAFADRVATGNPFARILIIIHSFLTQDALLDKDGVTVWEKFAMKHRNVILTFNGHDYGNSQYVNNTKCHTTDGISCTESDHTVWSMFSNFQGVPNGDPRLGALEVVSICPQLGKLRVAHYSPWSNQCFYDPEYRFVREKSDGIDFSVACGDGVVGYDAHRHKEECDDGNTRDGDCCSSTCTVEPGCRRVGGIKRAKREEPAHIRKMPRLSAPRTALSMGATRAVP